MSPAVVGEGQDAALVVPLFSWYHSDFLDEARLSRPHPLLGPLLTASIQAHPSVPTLPVRALSLPSAFFPRSFEQSPTKTLLRR